MPASRSNEQYREGSTPIIHLQLYKRNGPLITAKIPLGEISTLTLTYFNQVDDAVINSRNAQNVLNANNVKVTQDGEIIWTLQTADTACQDTAIEDGKLESHVAVFKWVLTNGTRGSARIPVYVIRDSKV